MEDIKKQLQAYILLESLIALGVLVTIASLIIGQLGHQQAVMAERRRQQDVLNVATMAVQTRQDQLTIDGISVTVSRSQQGITVFEGGKVVISLVKD